MKENVVLYFIIFRLRLRVKLNFPHTLNLEKKNNRSRQCIIYTTLLFHLVDNLPGYFEEIYKELRWLFWERSRNCKTFTDKTDNWKQQIANFILTQIS